MTVRPKAPAPALTPPSLHPTPCQPIHYIPRSTRALQPQQGIVSWLWFSRSIGPPETQLRVPKDRRHHRRETTEIAVPLCGLAVCPERSRRGRRGSPLRQPLTTDVVHEQHSAVAAARFDETTAQGDSPRSNFVRIRQYLESFDTEPITRDANEQRNGAPRDALTLNRLEKVNFANAPWTTCRHDAGYAWLVVSPRVLTALDPDGCTRNRPAKPFGTPPLWRASDIC
jgi:hypothetical protein